MNAFDQSEPTIKEKALSLAQRFRSRFGTDSAIYRAPGRVNLIGDHTDYNDGYVMPAAIDLHCWIAALHRPDQKLVLASDNFQESYEIDLADDSERRSHSWHDYPVGVAMQLKRSGYRLQGANLLIRGDVPIGAGLSSSAAIEVATAYALMDVAGHTIDRIEIARICQKAENEFVGANCGIMDQFVSLHGRRDHALMLDCRSLEYELIPIPQSTTLVVCNTMVKHAVATGEYNRRREECGEALRLLSSVLPNLRALRDVDLEQLEQHRSSLPETLWRRVRHVVSENGRVMNAAAAFRSADLAEFGKLMAESHQSLRDDYEVSCAELDLMVELALLQKGIYGARMTGGGFGGCTINLVDARHADSFCTEIGRAYENSTGIRPETYVCTVAGAAGSIDSESKPAAPIRPSN